MARIPRVMVSPDWLQQALAAGDPARTPAFLAGQVHRLTHVLRLAAGATVEVFADGVGAYQGVLAGAAAQGFRLTALQPVSSAEIASTAATAAAPLIIACGWPRAKRADFLVEKLVELGVDVLQPVVFERSERGERFGADKLARYTRLIAKACEQSRRNGPLELRPPQAWEAFLPMVTGRRFVATGAADETALSLAAAIAAGAPEATAEALTVAIGPEGGLTAAEIEAALQAGWIPVRLGPLTLRVETAAIAAAAAVQQARLNTPSATTAR